MRTKKRRNIKEEILKKSTKLFLMKSYAGTSVKDIIDAVRIGKGTFYWHFKSKGDLLEKIIERFEAIFLEGLIESVKAKEGDVVEKFKELHRHGSMVASKERELSIAFTTLSAELCGSGSKAEKKMKEVYRRYHEFVKELLEEGKKQKKVREDIESDIAAHVIIGFHDGVFLEWYRNEDKIDGKVLAKAFRDLVLNGLLYK